MPDKSTEDCSADEGAALLAGKLDHFVALLMVSQLNGGEGRSLFRWGGDGCNGGIGTGKAYYGCGNYKRSDLHFELLVIKVIWIDVSNLIVDSIFSSSIPFFCAEIGISSQLDSAVTKRGRTLAILAILGAVDGGRLLANLHQINVQLDSAQDRLLLRVRTDDDSEILAWLTRRYTRLLLGALVKLANQGQSKGESTIAGRAVDSMQRDIALAKADFDTNYKQSAVSHPLGDEPVLLSGFSYSSTEEDLFTLSLRLPDKRSINLNLSRELLFVFIKLLDDAARKAEWDLAAATHPETEPTLTVSQNQVLH